MPGGIFHHSKIKEVFADGFYYYGYKEQIQYINFRECRMHWVRYVNESPDFEQTDLEETSTKIVGWRDPSARPLYIEFFTEPRTRFTFEYRKNFWEWLLGKPAKREIREYIAMVETLVKHGWQTYDRSLQKKPEEPKKSFLSGL